MKQLPISTPRTESTFTGAPQRRLERFIEPGIGKQAFAPHPKGREHVRAMIALSDDKADIRRGTGLMVHVQRDIRLMRWCWSRLER